MLKAVRHPIDSLARGNNELPVRDRSYCVDAGVVVAEREGCIQRAIRIEPHDGAGRLVCECILIEEHDVLSAWQKHGSGSKDGNRKKRRVKVLIEAK